MPKFSDLAKKAVATIAAIFTIGSSAACVPDAPEQGGASPYSQSQETSMTIEPTVENDQVVTNVEQEVVSSTAMTTVPSGALVPNPEQEFVLETATTPAPSETIVPTETTVATGTQTEHSGVKIPNLVDSEMGYNIAYFAEREEFLIQRIETVKSDGDSNLYIYNNFLSVDAVKDCLENEQIDGVKVTANSDRDDILLYKEIMSIDDKTLAEAGLKTLGEYMVYNRSKTYIYSPENEQFTCTVQTSIGVELDQKLSKTDVADILNNKTYMGEALDSPANSVGGNKLIIALVQQIPENFLIEAGLKKESLAKQMVAAKANASGGEPPINAAQPTAVAPVATQPQF
ncbi:MAG: hypothetical protein LBM38_04005 [Clostridiales bacterium]|jgi:hypothetical protein|nr:hypothetical protein [Clostridiales bacterium]